LALGQLEHGLDLRQSRHVGAQAADLAAELAGGGLQPPVVDVRQHQAGALAGRRLRDGPPPPPGASGDDDDAVPEVEEVVHRITCRGPTGRSSAARPWAARPRSPAAIRISAASGPSRRRPSTCPPAPPFSPSPRRPAGAPACSAHPAWSPA